VPKRQAPPPSQALEERWRWLAHQASGGEDVKRHTLEMLEDAASAQARVRDDYHGRYPLELLQNAHDACADARHVGTVHYAVTPTALLVANEGVPFTHERVKSLLRLGASEKVARRSRSPLIGYKGIGFSGGELALSCARGR
jgi:hypothetical protein